jgi:hypothetical protein
MQPFALWSSLRATANGLAIGKPLTLALLAKPSRFLDVLFYLSQPQAVSITANLQREWHPPCSSD